MSWMILAIISIITVSIANLLERVLMRGDHSDPISYAIVFQVFLGLVSLMFALLLGKFVLPTDWNMLPRFVLSSTLWAGSTSFSFYAMKKLTAGEVTVLNTFGTIISILLGVIFLGEVFQTQTLIGSLLIFLSLMIIYVGKLSFNFKQGIIFALLSAACGGIAVVNDTVILHTYESFSYVTIMSFLPGIVLALLFPRSCRKAKVLMNIKSLLFMIILCVFYSIQAITYYLALENGAPISQMSPLIKSSIILTVILGAICLGERDNLFRKILAAIIVTIGAILIG